MLYRECEIVKDVLYNVFQGVALGLLEVVAPVDGVEPGI
jgi:hypothetical protein